MFPKFYLTSKMRETENIPHSLTKCGQGEGRQTAEMKL
jgi:hypothetical protein